MKAEQWEYITNNWGTTDPVIMEQIAQIKDADAAEAQALAAQVEERDAKILELTQQNIDLNKTNMNLILRLTDPKLAPEPEPEPEPEAPDLSDLDAFVKE